MLITSKFIRCALFLGFWGTSCFAQSFVTVGTQVPLSYNLGYEYKTPVKVSVEFNAGIMAPPYNNVMVNVLDYFGVENVALLVENSFSGGFQLQPRVNFVLGKFYLGFQTSFISLTAKDTPREVMETLYGIEFRRENVRVNTPINLTSRMYSFGGQVGYSIALPKSFRLKFDLSFSKVFSATSTLSADSKKLVQPSQTLHSELDPYYTKYGYLPSISITLARKL